MNKKILIVVGLVIIILLVGAGGFWGGMVYKANQDSQVQANFFEQRGGPPVAGQMPDGGQILQGTPFPGGGPGDLGFIQGAPRGGGTMGQVKSIEGNVITLSTAQDVTTINLSDSTTIVMSIEGSIGDIKPGMRVMVVGEQDEDGNITASQITIVNSETLAGPTRTAP